MRNVAHTVYRKKPVEVEAFKYDGSWSGRVLIQGWIEGGDFPVVDGFQTTGPPMFMQIKTLEGTMAADPGDWIIKGIEGEFYPCKPDIFEKTYELVKGAHHEQA